MFKIKEHNTTFTMNLLDCYLNKIIKDNIDIDYNLPDLSIYSKEHIDNRIKTLLKYKDKLNELKCIPHVKQRTDEWFKLRENRLTASDLGEAIKNNNLNLIKKKSGLFKDNINYGVIPALKWGVMFESMAARCYSQMFNNINIIDFGLIPHKTLEHFGASPDGINEFGIMIEIKCPYSREIKDNSIPEKYYMQIQGQLAVCELEECDYIECCFKTYNSAYKYVDIVENELGNSFINHGIIAEYKNIETDDFEYLYSNENLKASDAFNNINKKIYDYENDLINKNKKLVRLSPWILEKINIQRVTFDKELWDNTIPKIINFWEKVEEFKKNPIQNDTNIVKNKKKIEFIDDD